MGEWIGVGSAHIFTPMDRSLSSRHHQAYTPFIRFCSSCRLTLVWLTIPHNLSAKLPLWFHSIQYPVALCTYIHIITLSSSFSPHFVRLVPFLFPHSIICISFTLPLPFTSHIFLNGIIISNIYLRALWLLAFNFWLFTVQLCIWMWMYEIMI